jgi:MFS family permease
MAALLPAGWAVDAFGDRVVLVGGGVATALLTMLACLAPSFAVLIPLLILVGLGVATPTPAGSTAIMSAFPVSGRGLVMSIRQTGIPIGSMLAALILPSIAVAFGWRSALFSAAVGCVAGTFIGWLLFRGTERRGPTGARRATGSIRGVMTRDATLLGLAGIGLCVGQFTLFSYIVLYLFEDWHVPLLAGSLFLVASSVAGIAGRLGWGLVSDRIFGGRRSLPLVLISGIAATACLTLAWLPNSVPLVAMLVVVVIYGFTVVGWNGIWIALLSEIAPLAGRGRSVGYGMMVSHVGIITGPFAFGLAVDLSHSYRFAWTLVACGLVASALLFGLVREGGSRAALPPGMPEGPALA